LWQTSLINIEHNELESNQHFGYTHNNSRKY